MKTVAAPSPKGPEAPPVVLHKREELAASVLESIGVRSLSIEDLGSLRVTEDRSTKVARLPKAPPEDEVDPVQVAHFRSQPALTGFVLAFAAACRDGIPATVMQGYMRFNEPGRDPLIVDPKASRRRWLEAEIEEQELLRDNAHREVLRARPGVEEWRVESYRNDELNAQTRVTALKRELSALAEDTISVCPEEFVTYSDLLERGMGRLTSCGNKLTWAERIALDHILAEFRIEQRLDGQWWAIATVRLATPDGGLALLGPFSWSLGPGGNGGAIARAKLDGLGERTDRGELLALFGEHTSLGRETILTVLNSPFPELPHVLLNGLGGQPFPGWVSKEWRQKGFVNWVSSVYSGEVEVPWQAGPRARNVSFSHLRQLVAHLAAQRGTVSEQEVVDLVGVPLEGPFGCAVRDFTTTGGRIWYAPVVRVAGDPLAYASVRCVCREPAYVVARSPEVPRDLLCGECGRMPDAKMFGMDPRVRFPRAYTQTLLLSFEECVAEVARRYAPSNWKPSARQVQILEDKELFERGATVPTVSQRFGVPPESVRYDLKKLERYGLLASVGSGRQRNWWLPEEGSR